STPDARNRVHENLRPLSAADPHARERVRKRWIAAARHGRARLRGDRGAEELSPADEDRLLADRSGEALARALELSPERVRLVDRRRAHGADAHIRRDVARRVPQSLQA